MPAVFPALAIAFALVSWVICCPAAAHPPAIVNAGTEKIMGEEVEEFRKRMAEAIRKKDVAAITAMYADSFLHTDDSGATEDKTTRIARLLSGAPAIETAPAEDLRIRVSNGWAAVASGRSALAASGGGKPHQVRWSVFYVRVGDGWQVAASHETRLPESK